MGGKEPRSKVSVRSLGFGCGFWGCSLWAMPRNAPWDSISSGVAAERQRSGSGVAASLSGGLGNRQGPAVTAVTVVTSAAATAAGKRQRRRRHWLSGSSGQ